MNGISINKDGMVCTVHFAGKTQSERRGYTLMGTAVYTTDCAECISQWGKVLLYQPIPMNCPHGHTWRIL